MKRTTQSILSCTSVLEHNEIGCQFLTELSANREPERVFVLSGLQEYTEDADSNWGAWLDASLDSLADKAGQMEAPYPLKPGMEGKDYFVFRPLIINYNPRGVHFIDHLLGADVFRLDNGSWQVKGLESPVGQLEPPELDALPAWQTMKHFAEAFLACRARGVYFALPTIASALNIAVNLYGQDIFLAMIEDPDAVRRDLAVINDTLCRIHRWYIERIPLEQLQCIVPEGRFQPPGSGQICGCTTQLISSDLYSGFIAPLDDAVLSLYPRGGLIHLCGSHTQHITTWKEMKSLRAIQINDRAADDLPAYFAGLRDDQMMYVNPSNKMSTGQVLAITKGRRLVLCRP